MASAVRWQILQKLLEILKNRTWSPENEDSELVETINNEVAIVYRKSSNSETDENRGKSNEILPGIIVSCPSVDFEMNYNHGTNVLDQVPIRFLIQFIDRDNNLDSGGEKTYWKWQETCFGLLSEGSEKFEPLEEDSQGSIVAVRVKYVDNVNEKYWVKHGAFVAGIEVEFQVQFERLT